MVNLNGDILYEIVNHLAAFHSKDSRKILRNLSLVCRGVCASVRPVLFAEVKWPHPDKHDDVSGLHLFPETLWPYFRHFHLDWPDRWPDANPPLWGTKPASWGGEYIPKNLDKLEAALPKMTNVHIFQMTCPFDPPLSLIHCLAGCANITDLRITDTPLYLALLSDMPHTFNVERLTFLPVGEAARVGEGPFDRRYHDVAYYTRGYRKRYQHELQRRTTRTSARWYLFLLCRTETLTFLQLSGDYCSFGDFDHRNSNGRSWSCLQTLIFTGPPPTLGSSFEGLPDVIRNLPKLRDLRVLLCKPTGAGMGHQAQPQLSMIKPRGLYRFLREDELSPPTVYAQITSLAMSNLVDMKGVLKYTTALERLAVSAVIHQPRVPIALTREQIDELLDDLITGGGNEHLKQIRIMSEDDLDAGFFANLGHICPALESVEMERCGYREGEESVQQWEAYAAAFTGYKHLKELRIVVRFAGCGDHDHDADTARCRAYLLNGRRRCAMLIAARVPTLRRIGLEYRARASSHRYEDRWLDFDIIRLADGGVRLVELKQTWYQFPEVWKVVPLED